MARKKSMTPSQRDHRRMMTYRDQHGRKWIGTAESATLHPVGELLPDGFSPPVQTDQKFFRFNDDDPGFFTIDYDALIAHIVDRHRQYNTALTASLKEAYPSNWGGLVNDPPLHVLQAVGRKPINPKLFAAMRQGNKWSLGLEKPAKGKSVEVPEWAQPLLPEPEVDPVEAEFDFDEEEFAL
jgi:hypothetical protein